MDGAEAAVSQRVAVINLGCPKNLVDSETMAGLLGQAGFVLTDAPTAADAIVVNTCAFIGPAREEAWEVIGQAAASRREGTCRALIVAGCLAQGFPGDVRRRVPEVDRLLGTGDFGRVVEAVRSVLEESGRRPEPGFGPPGYLPSGAAPRLLSTPPHYAYLKIAEGCNHRCAFCLIPSLRGPYRSRPVEDVVAEAVSLDRMGVRELILVAQDTTVYGRDLGGRPLLADLVRRLQDETSFAWIRTLYGYPSTLPDDFVALLSAEAERSARFAGPSGADLPAGWGRLCRYLDLPMQHASDRILRAMRRPETNRFLTELVGRLRRDVPGISLRSTFIVGFPGETEEDFQTLLAFLAEARLENVGFFSYSPEAGTRAAQLPGQVPEQVKEERVERAAALQRRISLAGHRALVGRRLRVIVDEVRPARNAGFHLLTRGEADAPEIDGTVGVRWSGAAPSPGDLLEVVVTKATAYDLTAEGPALPDPTA